MNYRFNFNLSSHNKLLTYFKEIIKLKSTLWFYLCLTVSARFFLQVCVLSLRIWVRVDSKLHLLSDVIIYIYLIQSSSTNQLYNTYNKKVGYADPYEYKVKVRAKRIKSTLNFCYCAKVEHQTSLVRWFIQPFFLNISFALNYYFPGKKCYKLYSSRPFHLRELNLAIF